jgi:short-subunit dehydrogenase
MKADARAIALVTGASSGIGAALARELARHGHDLVLVARRLEPMNRLADELRAVGACATVVAADLSQVHAAAGLADEIRTRNLAIDVLINAAGLGANGRFDQSDPARIEQMLLVNIVALTELTRLVVPGMVARRRGKIMLVASTAGFQPGPQMAVYCASKAYVLSLGEAIAYELRDTGVTVTTLCPGPTATEFAATANAADVALFKNTLMSPMSAAEVARIGYQGLTAGRRVVITGLVNQIMAISGRLSPPSMTMPVSSRLMTQSRSS